MTNITRPLDAAAAHMLSTISNWAADELAARISAKAAIVTLGYSNASCSRYVDVATETDAVCVRISDHSAMSYNRAGDFNIALETKRGRGDLANVSVRLTALYMAEHSTPIAFDEDGEIEEWDMTYTLTEDSDAEGAEFEGWQVDNDALDAAITRAAAFVMSQINA